MNEIRNNLSVLFTLFYSYDWDIDYFSNDEIWNFDYNADVDFYVECDFFNLYNKASVLYQIAIDAKRKGLYDKALSIYMSIIEDQKFYLKYVTVAPFRSIFKLLICLNRYKDAYKLVCILLNKMEKKMRITNNFDYQMYYSLLDYKRNVEIMTIKAIEFNDYSSVDILTNAYAGNDNYEYWYDFKTIQDDLKDAYKLIKGKK